MLKRATVIVAILATITGACSDDEREATVIAAQLVDERTLVLNLAACNATKNEATVSEAADAVTVRVITTDPADGDDCSDGITIELEHPLGDRDLIDASTDARVEVTAEP